MTSRITELDRLAPSTSSRQRWVSGVRKHAFDIRKMMVAVVHETASEQKNGSLTTLASDAGSFPLVGREARQQRGRRSARLRELAQHNLWIFQVVRPLLGEGCEVAWGELGHLLAEHAVDALGVELDDIAHVGGVSARVRNRCYRGSFHGVVKPTKLWR
jgi:hypothetical protein